MTTEEKAKAYDEALKRARKIHSEIVNNELLGFPGQIEDIFPQLRESEDERIRRDIVAAVEMYKDFSQGRKGEIYAWLEKQKERRAYWELYKGVSESEWFKENYKGKSLGEEKQKPLTEEEYHKMSEELYKNHPWYMQKCIYGDTPSAERCKYCSASCKARVEEQKPIFKKGDKVIWDDEEFNILDVNVDSYNVGGYNLPFYRQNELSLVEQKPAEWSEEDKKLIDDVINSLCCYQNTLSDYQKEIVGEEIRKLKSLKPQPKQEWSEVELEFRGEKVKVKRPFFRDDNGRGYSTTEQDDDVAWYALRAWCEKKCVSLYDLYPRGEWSEEDERIIDTIVSVLGQYIDYKTVSGTGSGYATPRYNKEIDWLKSLRPSWRPTEEQIDYLSGAYANAVAENDEKAAKVLGSLHDDLTKMMPKDWVIDGVNIGGKPVETEPYSVRISPTKGWRGELDIDTLRDWSMRYAPDIREAIEATAYHFYNLRPSWKPTEEQMDSLRDTIVQTKGYSYSMYLPELYEQLKKLM